MGVRSDLAAAISAQVLPTYPGMQVYAHPEDITQVPALVLVPDDPWCEPATLGGNRSGTVRWSFELAILGHRGDPESTMEMMETVRPLVEQAVGSLGGTWTTLGKPDTVEVAGIMTLMASMNLALMTGRQT